VEIVDKKGTERGESQVGLPAGNRGHAEIAAGAGDAGEDAQRKASLLSSPPATLGSMLGKFARRFADRSPRRLAEAPQARIEDGRPEMAGYIISSN
jgi:hypothetical protein